MISDKETVVETCRRRVAVSCLIFMLALCVQLQPVRAESKRVAIVFSQETANHFFDPIAYAQLFAAVQHQAMMAGIPFDVLPPQS